eukprot:COSAG02_NODE_3423_length_6770_cov_5.903912_4_plen_91_part_00
MVETTITTSARMIQGIRAPYALCHPGATFTCWEAHSVATFSSPLTLAIYLFYPCLPTWYLPILLHHHYMCHHRPKDLFLGKISSSSFEDY